MANQGLPRLWLLSDERLAGQLWAAAGRLPRGSGIVLRHYSLPRAERMALGRRLALLARRRGLLLVAAGLPGFDGVHWHRSAPRHRPRCGIITASAHGAAELRSAFRAGADLVFLSPAYPTPSHPQAQALGPVRFGLERRGATGAVIALGGIDTANARRLPADGIAGISLWLETRPQIKMPRGRTGRTRASGAAGRAPAAASASALSR
jgi:thiamine-phosphate pyrophosphorylase